MQSIYHRTKTLLCTNRLKANKSSKTNHSLMDRKFSIPLHPWLVFTAIKLQDGSHNQRQCQLSMHEHSPYIIIYSRDKPWLA